jgi:hypothetical protein
VTTVVAKAENSVYFNFSDTNSNGLLVSDISTTSSVADFTYGSGTLEIDAAIQNTGVLPSGGSLNINLNSLTKTYLNYSSTVSLSGVKAIIISNLSTESGRNIRVMATGSNAFTNMFNGGSGNLIIRPYGSHVYIDPWKTVVSASQKNIQLFDVSGSGASYSYSVLGNLT